VDGVSWSATRFPVKVITLDENRVITEAFDPHIAFAVAHQLDTLTNMQPGSTRTILQKNATPINSNEIIKTYSELSLSHMLSRVRNKVLQFTFATNNAAVPSGSGIKTKFKPEKKQKFTYLAFSEASVR